VNLTLAAAERQRARHGQEKEAVYHAGEREATKKELVRQKTGGEEQWQWQI
jgi:hypothetical protein